MGALGIPGVINNFNLYNNGTALVGLTGEISLPDFEGMTETLSGPGILGEIEEVIIGQFGSMELEIPFRILDEDAFKLMSPATSLNLTLRASEQFTVKSTGGIDYKGMRVVVRGRQKKLTGGTVKQGGAMDAAVTVEITYIMIELDGKQRIELDKINNVYKVNGVDLLAKIRKQLYQGGGGAGHRRVPCVRLSELDPQHGGGHGRGAEPEQAAGGHHVLHRRHSGSQQG